MSIIGQRASFFCDAPRRSLLSVFGPIIDPSSFLALNNELIYILEVLKAFQLRKIASLSKKINEE